MTAFPYYTASADLTDLDSARWTRHTGHMMSSGVHEAAGQPIGVFDSGVGGLSVLIELRRLLPTEDFVYFADSGHCPYGARPATEIQALSEQAGDFLRTQGAKALVVACNTASAAGLDPLRARHEPEVPVIGLVPAVKPAVALTRSGMIGVLATPGTLRGALLRDVIAQWATPAGVRVVCDPGVGLVEAVEADQRDAPATHAILRGALGPMQAAGVDVVVLGCTHYPFLRPQIAALAGLPLQTVDSGQGVARQTARRLAEAGRLHPGSAPGNVRFYTSGDPLAVGAVMGHLLGVEVRCESWQ